MITLPMFVMVSGMRGTVHVCKQQEPEQQPKRKIEVLTEHAMIITRVHSSQQPVQNIPGAGGTTG